MLSIYNDLNILSVYIAYTSYILFNLKTLLYVLRLNNFSLYYSKCFLNVITHHANLYSSARSNIKKTSMKKYKFF